MPFAAAASRRFAAVAMACAAVIMGYQVASRATRDALFLSSYDPRSLPLMVAAASLLSIAGAFAGARLLSRAGPARVIPAAFAVSGLLTLAEWLLAAWRPALGSVVVYLHVTAVSPVLLSGFWSIVSERFDPRSARRELGRIAALGTLGGLAGGLLAERSASWLGVTGTLAVLALLQFGCAWLLRTVPGSRGRGVAAGTGAELAGLRALRHLAATSYLRNLALLVLGSSVSAALLDYLFKAQSAAAAGGGAPLVRWFAVFYAGVALLTFAIQALFTRAALGRAGLAPSIGALPGAVALGGVASALVPGPWSIAFVRGLEAVLRGSLFRSGYEVLYSPIPPGEKRGTKAIVDVGFDRLGDMAGAGLVAIALLLPATATTPALLALAVAFALATLALVARLQRGYVSSLEAGLRAGADRHEAHDEPDWTLAHTLSGPLDFAPTPTPAPVPGGAPATPSAPGPGRARVPAPAEWPDDALTAALVELRSGDAARVRASLAAAPLPPGLVAQGIELLAWDEVASDAIQALRTVAPRHVGQLVDSLLDPSTEFTVRRRLPPVLAASHTPRAVDGLMGGLVDTRFEVRYRCGRALDALLAADTRLRVEPGAVFEAVRREARVGRAVWKSQRLLEQLDDAGPEPFLDEFVRQRAGRSLEHVFTLLALVLPREPLRIAFGGLHAGDPMLRGLSLEYLESVLPAGVRDELWPHLEAEPVPRGTPGRGARDRGEILDDLLRSHVSMQIGVEELRRAQPPAGPAS